MITQKIATKIVKKLSDNGYKAYFVGGWVRDLIMELPSDDIDIASNAPPEIIMQLFEHTIPVGSAFGSVIVVLENKQFEVSTFRTDGHYSNGRHPQNVTYSSPEEDAKRRDFTINGLFYDPIKKEIIDLVDGRKDIKNKIIRAIGKPEQRFQEDKLRIIRAVRFAVRLGFTIEEKTKLAIISQAKNLFPAVAMERIWQEFNKMAKHSNFYDAIIKMKELGLLEIIFPKTKKIIPKKLPENSPTILWITELFPEKTLEQQLEICEYLKTTNKDKKTVENLYLGKQLASQKDTEDASWAHFYAIPNNRVLLEIISQNPAFLEQHRLRNEKLHNHIRRIIEKTPLIQAKDLDVPPGKLMGTLLKEAERIAINKNIENKDEILKYLH